jgi:hypothetical protein
LGIGLYLSNVSKPSSCFTIKTLLLHFEDELISVAGGNNRFFWQNMVKNNYPVRRSQSFFMSQQTIYMVLIYRVWCGNVKESDYLEDLGIDGIIVFVWSLIK